VLIVSYIMPKIAIDYSKTIIYKLVCNDLSVTDLYVGHTTNFTKRKNSHKSDCFNKNKKEYNYKVYQFIRVNGGWENWNMVQIEEFCCNNKIEACARERYWYEDLKGTLNTNYPARTKKEHYEDNKEQLLENMKEWFEANKEKKKEQIAEYKKKWYEANKEKIKEYREVNKEKITEYHKQYQKKYYEANKDKISEYQKKYVDANKDARNARQRELYKAKKLNPPQSL